jgi:hypothetical protein
MRFDIAKYIPAIVNNKPAAFTIKNYGNKRKNNFLNKKQAEGLRKPFVKKRSQCKKADQNSHPEPSVFNFDQ